MFRGLEACWKCCNLEASLMQLAPHLVTDEALGSLGEPELNPAAHVTALDFGPCKHRHGGPL